jgi:hypothetical protein
MDSHLNLRRANANLDDQRVFLMCEQCPRGTDGTLATPPQRRTHRGCNRLRPTTRSASVG